MKITAGLLLLVSTTWGTGLPTPLISQVTNAPNPVDIRLPGPMGQTQISYQLAGNADVQVVVYDLLGQRVRQWRFSSGDAGGRLGDNAFVWDGTNEQGDKVSKGGYLAQIQVQSVEGTAQTIRKIGVIH